MDRAIMVDIPTKAPVEVVVPVAEVLRAGAELRKQCNTANQCNKTDKPRKRVKPIYDEKKVLQCPRYVVNKVEFPEDKKFQGCHHGRAEKLLIRLGVNRKQIQKTLAAPTPVRLEKPRYPYYVQKPIHCPTFRLAQLAQPKKRLVHQTWLRYADVLDPYHIENCMKNMKEINVTDTKDAVEYFTQKKNTSKQQRRKRHREIRKLQKKIQQLDQQELLNNVQSVIDVLYLKNFNFLIGTNVHMMTFERLKLAEYLLKTICSSLKYELPERTSKAMFDMFIVNLCDNLAIYLSSMRTMSGYNMWDDWAKRVVRRPKTDGEEDGEEEDEEMRVPVDGYIDYSTDDASSTTCESTVDLLGEDEGEGEGEFDGEEEGEGYGKGKGGKGYGKGYGKGSGGKGFGNAESFGDPYGGGEADGEGVGEEQLGEEEEVLTYIKSKNSKR